jgi:hypothetical protein
VSTRRAVLAGVLLGLAYGVAVVLRGDVAPGIVGGALLAVLTFLLIRRVEAHNERRRRALERRREPSGQDP